MSRQWAGTRFAPPRVATLPFANMPSPTPRARAWVFTINNYTDEHIDRLTRLACQYVVYGKETAPETGTPHIQGYLYIANKVRRATLARLLPGAYLQPANGSPQENRDYCTKDGDFYERGTIPTSKEERNQRGGAANAARWKNLIEKAEAGDMDWIKTNDPHAYVQLKPKLESMYAPGVGPLDGNLLHEWWVGPSGTGKSKTLWELYPNHFAKGINKWWDGYKHEEVVAIEEWSPDNGLTAQALKKWADRYPFPGEIKGGLMTRLRPKKIIVLSNYTLEQCFPRQEDLEPLKRRFKVIEFPSAVQHAHFRAAWFTNPVEESAGSENTTEDLSSLWEDELPDLDLDTLLG